MPLGGDTHLHAYTQPPGPLWAVTSSPAVLRAFDWRLLSTEAVFWNTIVLWKDGQMHQSPLDHVAHSKLSHGPFTSLRENFVISQSPIHTHTFTYTHPYTPSPHTSCGQLFWTNVT